MVNSSLWYVYAALSGLWVPSMEACCHQCDPLTSKDTSKPVPDPFKFGEFWLKPHERQVRL